jgi:hypothetical protein
MDSIILLIIFVVFVATIKQLPRPKLIGMWAVATVTSLLIFAHHATSTLNLNF